MEVDSLFVSTARLIANPVSFKLKFDRLHKLVSDMRAAIENGGNKG